MRKILTLLLALPFLSAPAAAADDKGATASAFMKCARIAGDAQRLSCYDRLATELIELGLTGLEAPPPAAPAAPSGVTPAPAEAPASPEAVAVAGSLEGPPEAPVFATGGGAAAVATNEEGFGLERVEQAQDKDVKRIQSRYVGDFTGWDGKTVFRLENGQIWQQIEAGRMAWRATNPMITIKRGFMGSYMLSVEGVNKTVRVKRIQ